MVSMVEGRENHSETRKKVLINGHAFPLHDREPQGDQILAAGGFEPVDDHVLIQRMSPGSRVISLDETVEIEPGVVPVFYAFRGGDAHLFTVDTHGYQWGEANISEEQIRDIAQVRVELILEVIREDEEPRLLSPGDPLPLTPRGVEHLRTRSREIEVFLDGDAKMIARGVYTTEQLIDRLGVDAGYLLNLKTKGGLETLGPGQRVHVKEGMEFFSQAPGGASS